MGRVHLCYPPSMRPSLLTGTLLAALFAPAATYAQTTPVPARIAQQNALFAESWQTNLQLSPTLATGVGDYRYNDQLGDYSLAAAAKRHDVNLAYLTRIKAIDPTGFPEQDRISHDLFLRNLQESADTYDLKDYEMPLGGGGVHTGVADLPLAMPFDSVKHYEDYIARLHQIPKAFLQTEDVLRQGVKDKLVPVRFIAEKIPGQCDGVVKPPTPS